MICVDEGFTEEFIDEIKETLSSSNLYVLATAALVTAVQVRLRHSKHYNQTQKCLVVMYNVNFCLDVFSTARL